MSLTRHLLAGTALLVNLWVGGDLIEAEWGLIWRSVFEIVLIAGYLVFVWGYPARLRPPREGAEQDGDGGGGRPR